MLATYGPQQSRWLPRSIELLFGGRKEVDVDEQLRQLSRAFRTAGVHRGGMPNGTFGGQGGIGNFFPES
jgi:hypothetical protein